MPLFSNILIVCIGNICRSPMGEYLLKDKLGEDYNVSSAGLGALVGNSADKYSIEIMNENGIDISEHKARQLTKEMIHQNDLILVMDKRQKMSLEKKHPEARGRVFRLGKWDNMDIADPYKKDKQYFEEAFSKIELGVSKWIKRV